MCQAPSLPREGLGHFTTLQHMSGAHPLSHTPTNSQAPSPAHPRLYTSPASPASSRVQRPLASLWVLGLCLPLGRPAHTPLLPLLHLRPYGLLSLGLCPFSWGTFHIIPSSGQQQDQRNKRKQSCSPSTCEDGSAPASSPAHVLLVFPVSQAASSNCILHRIPDTPPFMTGGSLPPPNQVSTRMHST